MTEGVLRRVFTIFGNSLSLAFFGNSLSLAFGQPAPSRREPFFYAAKNTRAIQ